MFVRLVRKGECHSRGFHVFIRVGERKLHNEVEVAQTQDTTLFQYHQSTNIQTTKNNDSLLSPIHELSINCPLTFDDFQFILIFHYFLTFPFYIFALSLFSYSQKNQV